MTAKHFSEADLLETYYTQPGESMPVMMHLASCSECAGRYDRLDRKLREVAACSTDQPESFWARQRHLISDRISRQPSRRGARTFGIAASVLLAFTLGGLVTHELLDSPDPVVSTTTAVQVAQQSDAIAEQLDELPADPWESDALKPYASVVEWETW